MKNQKPIILQIPKPCNENWEEMTRTVGGRFCANCQKTVTDITHLSDNTIAQLLANKKEGICVRAFASQLNRPIQFPAQTPTRFYRIALALGLTILIANAAESYARPNPPLVEQNYFVATDDSTSKEKTSADSLKISGIVLDEKGMPHQFARIRFYGESNTEGIYVDTNGRFEFSISTNSIFNDTLHFNCFSTRREIGKCLFDKEYYNNGKKIEIIPHLDYVVVGDTN